jgi:hypothetical protein
VLVSVVSPVMAGQDVFGTVDLTPMSDIGVISRDESMDEMITLIVVSFPICITCRQWL